MSPTDGHSDPLSDGNIEKTAHSGGAKQRRFLTPDRIGLILAIILVILIVGGIFLGK